MVKILDKVNKSIVRFQRQKLYKIKKYLAKT